MLHQDNYFDIHYTNLQPKDKYRMLLSIYAYKQKSISTILYDHPQKKRSYKAGVPSLHKVGQDL